MDGVMEGGFADTKGRFYMSADATVGTKGDKIYEARITKASSQNSTMRSPITPSRLLYLSVIESPTICGGARQGRWEVAG
jgi:hypothetical protein